jgi:hypothetical protein
MDSFWYLSSLWKTLDLSRFSCFVYTRAAEICGKAIEFGG